MNFTCGLVNLFSGIVWCFLKLTTHRNKMQYVSEVIGKACVTSMGVIGV